MGLHPCCGGSLQTGTKIIAIIQIVLATIGLVILVVAGVGFLLISELDGSNNATIVTNSNITSVDDLNLGKNETSTEDEKDLADIALPISGSFFVGVLVGFILILGFYLMIGILLLKGAKQRDAWKCRVWLFIECLILLSSLVSFISGFFLEIELFHLFPTGISIIINMYFIWIVWVFVVELNENEEAKRDSLKRVVYNQNA